ncbi:nitroreductase family deazaflavin-dependent oxidoreductase [Catenuloplanes sp. NPDC051500]|uniref:nitroreductase family deazaflavin-dependent oxidoreductase n=1 Tax=Catenuloplanes sp. NPDC051500 TaxID=3363959 RepID=UPI0037AC1923
MIDDIRRALAITPASTAWERTADITTAGRRSGRPHRMETWFYRHDGRIYLSGLPGRRDWYANVRANPRLTFHLKHGVRADLPATARVVTGEEERRAAFEAFVADLNQPHDPARIGRPTDVAAWLAGSPLVEVVFDDARLR